jgi:predicted DNA-binding protein (UPF0251 family)
MDQFEAIRLADFMGFPQKEAAKSMHISQQTFSRILKKAHKDLANALIYGNTIKIQGGRYVISTKDDPNHPSTETPKNNPIKEP